MPVRLISLIIISWGIFVQANGQISIRDVRAMPPGAVVTASGTAITGNALGTIRYIQDGTGGIAIYSPALSNVVAGDSISVTGVLSVYRGELQITSLISHQLIATGKVAVPLVTGNLQEILHPEFVGRKVQLNCMGIQTCEPETRQGWYMLYDQFGYTTRLSIQAEDVMQFPLPANPYVIEGILTQFEDQYEIKALQLKPASIDTGCMYISPGKVHFAPNHKTVFLEWEIAAGHQEFQQTELWVVLDQDTLVQLTWTGIQNQIGFEVSQWPEWQGKCLSVHLQLNDAEGNIYTSAPLQIAFPSATSEKPDILFNRPIAIQFSDGSQPLAVGSSVIESDIIRRIDATQYTLDIAMYNTGRATIVQAINRAAQRGVQVRYIADDETGNNALHGSVLFPVKYRTGDGIMHHKFVIGDVEYPEQCFVWAGSTNFTANQLSSDPNHAIVFYDPALARAYKREFDELWGDASTGQLPRYGDFKSHDTPLDFAIGHVVVSSLFSPSDETACYIDRALSEVDYHVAISLLLLTDEILIDRIIDLHQSGKQVRVIVEDESSSSFALSRLRAAGVPVAIHDPGPIFHHKYAIIDEGITESLPTVITGSHNWTWSADNINDENTLIIRDQSVANIFRQEFEARWRELNPVSTNSPTIDLVKVFPNPAATYFSISHKLSEIASMVVTDQTGRLMLSSSLEPETIGSWDCSGMAPGIYFVEIAWNQGRKVFKLVVSR